MKILSYPDFADSLNGFRLEAFRKSLETPFYESRYTRLRIKPENIRVKLNDVQDIDIDIESALSRLEVFDTQDFSAILLYSDGNFFSTGDVNLVRCEEPIVDEIDSDKINLISLSISDIYRIVINKVFERPILFVVDAGDDELLSVFSRFYFQIDETVNIVQYFCGSAFLLSNVSEYILKESVKLNLSFFQDLSKNTVLHSIKKIIHKKDSSSVSTSMWSGGKIVLSTFYSNLNEGSSQDDIHIVLADSHQHIDFNNTLRHIGKRSRGNILLKGVLMERSRLVFFGKARVEKSANDSESFLSDHILVLDKDARADSIPSMEIENNQVKAKHGASIGHQDEEQIFYLMSRGLSETEAKNLIVEGFVSNYIEKFPLLKELAYTFLSKKISKAKD